MRKSHTCVVVLAATVLLVSTAYAECCRGSIEYPYAACTCLEPPYGRDECCWALISGSLGVVYQTQETRPCWTEFPPYIPCTESDERWNYYKETCLCSEISCIDNPECEFCEWTTACYTRVHKTSCPEDCVPVGDPIPPSAPDEKDSCGDPPS